MGSINYTYETGGVPTPRELEEWDHQFRVFELQPPEPHAHSEARRRGWGFEKHLKPPPDCFEFVSANLKRGWGVKLNDRLRPEAKFSLVTTLTAYFAWLRTLQGTRWLLHLNGIQLLEPHPGFVYFYKKEPLIEPQYGLRIYHVDRSARTAKKPDDYYGPELIDRLKQMLEDRRGPSQTPPLHANDSTWRSVGAFLRDWLIEKDADLDWPTRKPDRISGYVWARGLLQAGSQTDHVWTAIGKAEVYTDSRIYRIQRPAYETRMVGGVLKRVQPQHTGVVWDDRKNMHIVPRDDFDKMNGAPPDTIDRKYRCGSCGRIMCCTTVQGATNERLCMNCRGTQIESGDRRSLLWCQYRECRRCPEHLRTEEDLINLVSRFNVSSGHVRRA